MHLLTRLHNIAMIQRRNLPGVHDVAFLMTEEGIHTSDLEDEYIRSQFIFQPSPNTEYANSNTDQVATDANSNPSLQEIDVWNKQQQELALIAPTTRNKEDMAYIPSWMPPLPADHTYRSTAVYSDRTTNPKDIREKILEEGRVVEQALRKLGAMSQGASTASQTNDLLMLLDEGEDQLTTNTTAKTNAKMFDIVALAASRRKKAINPIILHIGKKGKA